MQARTIFSYVPTPEPKHKKRTGLRREDAGDPSIPPGTSFQLSKNPSGSSSLAKRSSSLIPHRRRSVPSRQRGVNDPSHRVPRPSRPRKAGERALPRSKRYPRTGEQDANPPFRHAHSNEHRVPPGECLANDGERGIPCSSRPVPRGECGELPREQDSNRPVDCRKPLASSPPGTQIGNQGA